MNYSASTQEIEITSLYFRNKPREHRLESYPKQMIYDGREYNFVESGMQYLVRKGQQLIKLFDVSDGDQLYRLRLEDDQWTLVNIKAGAQA